MAQVLSLTEPWHGSGRVINADSAFALCHDLEYNEPGDHHVLTASINEHSLVDGWIQLGNTSFPHTTQTRGQPTW